MNIFQSSYDNRLQSWYNLRNQIVDLTISQKCIEIDKINQEYLKNRGFEVYKSLKDVKEKSNFIFSSNVLEHIEDDQLAIMEMSLHLKNNLA
jgi:hypothetical protein